MAKAKSWAPDFGPFAWVRQSMRAPVEAVLPAGARVAGFDWLRFLAIVAVVSIHVTDVALRKNEYFPESTLEADLYYAFAACLRFCVPAFFLMSAFLLENRVLHGGPSPATRWPRYLSPLLAASLVYSASNVAIASALHKPISWPELLVLALTGRAAAHTWFLVNALVYAILHDYLRILAIGRAFAVLVLAYTLLFALTLGRVDALEGTHPLLPVVSALVFGIPYYVGGIWAARHLSSLQAVSTTGKILAVSGGIALSVAYGVFLHERSYSNPGTALLAVALFVVAVSAHRKPPVLVRRIATLSLGIYLWHLLVLLAVRIAEGRYYREVVSPGVTLLLVLGEVAAGLFGGLAISELLARVPVLRGLSQ